MKEKNRRHFIRYESKSMCEVTLGSKTYRGIVVDYSEGIGVIIKNTPDIVEGAEADVKILDYGTEYRSQIVWTESLGYHMRIGFRNLGNLKGNLEHYRLADILTGLNRGKKTGVLEVTTGAVVRKIYIENGSNVFAASSYKDDRLGEYLLKQGKITIEEFNQASRVVLKTGQKLGAALVDLGCIDRDDLGRLIQDQITAIIFRLFNLEEGLFEFKETSLPTHEPVTLQLSLANIIYRGIKQINNFVSVQKMCPPLLTIFNVSGYSMPMLSSLTLEDDDKIILSHINGVHPLNTILNLSPSTDFETLKTIVTLLSMEIIHIKEDDESPTHLPSEEIFREKEEAEEKVKSPAAPESPAEAYNSDAVQPTAGKSSASGEDGPARKWYYVAAACLLIVLAGLIIYLTVSGQKKQPLQLPDKMAQFPSFRDMALEKAENAGPAAAWPEFHNDALKKILSD